MACNTKLAILISVVRKVFSSKRHETSRSVCDYTEKSSGQCQSFKTFCKVLNKTVTFDSVLSRRVFTQGKVTNIITKFLSSTNTTLVADVSVKLRHPSQILLHQLNIT